MDAAASIINIIAITGTFVDYLRAAKQAPSERRKLLVEANSLMALLTSLKDFLHVEDRNDHLKWRHVLLDLDAKDGPFAQYHEGLESLLKKLSPKSRLERAMQTPLWKMKKEDVNEVLLRIERMKSLISIALEMDHTRLSEAIIAQLSEVLTTTRRIASNEDKRAFRHLLDQICLDDYSSVFRSNITEHTAAVGQNFIASAEFESWAEGADSCKTLLCLGDPGVGKTVMATKAIQALQTEDTLSRQAIVYIYCDCTRRRSRLYRRDSSPEARNKGVQTPAHFIASLLRQLLFAHGSPTSHVKDLMERHEHQKTRPKVEELEQAFSDVARKFDRIYIVVDAMDEFDSLELETFASALLTICSSSTTRLLLTSRKHPQVEQSFNDAVRLEMRADDKDTLLYLQSRARREFPRRLLRDPDALDRILSALLLSANGIPLIARLHMNALRGVRTPGAMLTAISKLTSNSDVYDETYQAAMERITKQPGELPAMAKRVLRWIVCAKRYLFAKELQCVLAVHEDSNVLDDDFVPDMDDVFLACEGLVCTVTDPDTETVRVELVHTTARQYFDRKLAEWAPDVSLDLTRTCLNVLGFKDLHPVPRSLVMYAYRYWGEHAKDVEDLNEEEQFAVLADIVRKFLAKDEQKSPLSQSITVNENRSYPVTIFQEGLTGYHLAAKFGLTRLFETLWEPRDQLEAMLGPHDHDKNPLQQAVFSESIEIVKAMIRLRSIDPNARNRANISPLQDAIVYQRPEMVKALLENGMADPTEVDSIGKPLILLAAETRQQRSLELLLGADAMDTAVRVEFAPLLKTLATSSDYVQWPPRYFSREKVCKHLKESGLHHQVSERLPLALNLRASLEMAQYKGLDLPVRPDPAV